MAEILSASPSTVVARAYGKVNLHLGCGQLRPDGYHDLVTIFQSLDLADTVRVSLAEEMSLSCAADGVPEDDSNLAWRAAQALCRSGEEAVAITIDKGIPTAGGMAGGSADAAATLLAVNHLLGGRYSQQELMAVAAQLGADVPFTLVGGTQLGTGRGDQLSPVLSRGTYHWVLVFAGQGLATPAVFHKLDTLERTPHMDTTAMQRALVSGDPEQVASALHNDLQPAALSLRPDLRVTLREGLSAGALAGVVSGSGPTCAFLCLDLAHAEAVAAEMSLGHRVAVARSH